jgi:hypothetical protein
VAQHAAVAARLAAEQEQLVPPLAQSQEDGEESGGEQ